MKILYIVRHAKSSWEDSTMSDFDRPLNNRGLHDAPMMGLKLKELGFIPDQIISSSANRALSTAKLLAESISYPLSKIIETKALYLADLSTMLKIVNSVNDEIDSLMLVGHNPGMTQIINYLAAENLFNLPTCSLSGIRFFIDNWEAVSMGLGKQFVYEYPKKYK